MSERTVADTAEDRRLGEGARREKNRKRWGRTWPSGSGPTPRGLLGRQRQLGLLPR
jgi:hypothetical protein